TVPRRAGGFLALPVPRIGARPRRRRAPGGGPLGTRPIAECAKGYSRRPHPTNDFTCRASSRRRSPRTASRLPDCPIHHSSHGTGGSVGSNSRCQLASSCVLQGSGSGHVSSSGTTCRIAFIHSSCSWDVAERYFPV